MTASAEDELAQLQHLNLGDPHHDGVLDEVCAPCQQPWQAVPAAAEGSEAPQQQPRVPQQHACKCRATAT
jgi:hypothetical protein